MSVTEMERDALSTSPGTLIYNTDSKKIEAAVLSDGAPAIDQSMTADRTSGNQLNATFSINGQSFKAGVSGQLTSVDISLYQIFTGGNFTLTIYEGEGFSGTELGNVTQAFTTEDSGIQTFDLNTANIFLVAETSYTWRVSVTGSEDAAVYRSGDNYPNGTSYIFNGGSAGCCDLYFVTRVASESLIWVPLN